MAKKDNKKAAKAAEKPKKAKKAAEKQTKSGLRKYLGLILSIVLFLALTVSMLFMGAYHTRTSAQENQVLNVSSEMEIVIQRLSKNIMDIDIYLKNELINHPDRDWAAISSLPQTSQYRLDEIKELRNLFENDLTAFIDGGKAYDFFTQEEVDINALEHEGLDPVRDNLKNAHQIWQLYKGLIDSMAADAEQLGILYAQNSQFLVDYTRNYSSQLIYELNKVTQSIGAHIQEEAKQFEQFQLGAIIAALTIFLFIVFGALRQLLRNDELLAVANREMAEIMSSVNEGLFLVDKDLVIGNEYSSKLEGILGQKEIAGRNLLDVLGELVTDEELDTTKTFIEQLYSEWVVEDLIDDLNPLNRIKIQREGMPDRHLDFKFFRVLQGSKIERVLVNVSDTTEIVMLQESQKDQREQEGQELEMLNIILNTNPTVLSSFIRDSQGKLEEINRALKSQSTTQRELKDKVVYIARLIHSIKGEASSIKLRRMVAICETFEESLATMKNTHILRGQDFLALVVWLEDLFRLFDILEGYNRRLNVSGSGPAITRETLEREKQSAYYNKFVQDIAERTEKQVRLVCEGVDNIQIPEVMETKLRGIAIQLLRNSMVHGIEDPVVRRNRGKDEVGTLRLKLAQDETGQVVMEVEDDGNGINFDAIRNKAISLGYNPDEVKAMNQQQLYNLMFSSGFSTASEQTEDAGRGVGMDIIKASVKEMGGKINISTQAEKNTRFKFVFPKPN